MKKLACGITFVALSLPSLNLFAEDGEQLFQLRCGEVCHQTPEPEMLKAKQWKRVVATMRKRMTQSGMADLTEEEYKKILSYLEQNARK